MSRIRSDLIIISNFQNELDQKLNDFNNINNPNKDNSSTVRGNMKAHECIDKLTEINAKLNESLKYTMNKIKNIGESFKENDKNISSQINGK